MRAIQYAGPFRQGETIELKVEDFKYSFVKISVETSYMSPLNSIEGIIPPTFQFVEPTGDTIDFRINENNILEWDKCKYGQFKIMFLEPMDAFTFINLTFANSKDEY